jgi:hypothetical protein
MQAQGGATLYEAPPPALAMSLKRMLERPVRVKRRASKPVNGLSGRWTPHLSHSLSTMWMASAKVRCRRRGMICANAAWKGRL